MSGNYAADLGMCFTILCKGHILAREAALCGGCGGVWGEMRVLYIIRSIATIGWRMELDNLSMYQRAAHEELLPPYGYCESATN